MTSSPSSLNIALGFLLVASIASPPRAAVDALGSPSTAAVVSGTSTVCGIVAGQPTQRIECYQNDRLFSVEPNTSFEAISGGSTFFCGLLSGGSAVLCWDTAATSFPPKRIYYSDTVKLTDLTVGDDHVCALEVDTSIARCWRGERKGSKFPSPPEEWGFRAITSGSGYTCGILKNNSRVVCWGHNAAGAEIQGQYGNLTMSTLVAGVSHACGLASDGTLVCKGNNDHGQSVVPFNSAFEFSGIALGANFSCAVRRTNGLVICWGGETNRFEYDSDLVESVSFETIVAGSDVICGLITWNLTMTCWGPGLSDNSSYNLGSDLPLGMIIPGPCVKTLCTMCGTYPNSNTLCHGSGAICISCQVELPIPLPLPPVESPPSQNLQPPSRPGRSLNRLSLAFLIVGSVGVFAGACTILYCLWAGVCGYFGKKMNDSEQVQQEVPEASLDSSANVDPSAQHSRSVSYKGQSSGSLNRDISGSWSSKGTDKTEVFSLSELVAATNSFSPENKIGSGSFGAVYIGKLADGRLVAIKRGETYMRTKKVQEKESAFGSELALLSRLNHKHLVGLVGFCQDEDERLLVYDYMSNGSLHDHLHNTEAIGASNEILNSWKLRIKVALDAARGVEYLHNYAVPPIIHRDIKSSNILLDSNWTARVSDFGLSLMGPESDQEYVSSKAVGTVGYIDPEYYVMNVLTTKSDVYGLGVVLLELLTGKRSVFRNEDGSGPTGLVEYMRPRILAGELSMVLDRRAEPPSTNEARAVELVAHTAIRCVSLEGKERPDMTKVVTDLERANSLCEGSHSSFTNPTFPISSE
ncbi:putative serine/threonine-protein kinase-like protein CCR3 [Rhodamnia argentea]|uniref:non-specific serine/threonine protein kinase n=1 Tax=Rhodamnia argentea TaxID=178133 RepID=A0A8B8PRI7_9MYRT|nr:putative serine/threonine-protein kinase-like protein CCR3 [Rhodamnia argentea]